MFFRLGTAHAYVIRFVRLWCLSEARLSWWTEESAKSNTDPLAWDESSDVWSLACIAMEMYTGEMLFPAHDNLEHLAMMEGRVA